MINFTAFLPTLPILSYLTYHELLSKSKDKQSKVSKVKI